MSYGFGKNKPSVENLARGPEKEMLDISGFDRKPLSIDREREKDAVERGEKIGFVDRGEGRAQPNPELQPVSRRRKAPAPTGTVFIKGPKDVVDWFIQFSVESGHRSYWETIAKFREMAERK